MQWKYYLVKSLIFHGTLSPKMKPTKVFLWKMTLGHKMCKISHSIRFRAQNGNWRPVEPHMCLLGISSYQWNSSFFENLDIERSRFWREIDFLTNKNFWDMNIRKSLRTPNILVMQAILTPLMAPNRVQTLFLSIFPNPIFLIFWTFPEN